MKCARLGISAPPVSLFAAAVGLVGGQPPWEPNSIPKWEDWLERPERTKSHAAASPLRSQTRPEIAKRGRRVFRAARSKNPINPADLPWPSAWSLRRHIPGPRPREFRLQFV